MASDSVFLTASRFRQGSEPSSVLFELRAMDSSSSEGTLLASEPSDLWTLTEEDGDLYRMGHPVLLKQDSNMP